jgi:hypothetical protein
MFEGVDIRLRLTCNCFITMNPGCVRGRCEQAQPTRRCPHGCSRDLRVAMISEKCSKFGISDGGRAAPHPPSEMPNPNPNPSAAPHPRRPLPCESPTTNRGSSPTTPECKCEKVAIGTEGIFGSWEVDRSRGRFGFAADFASWIAAPAHMYTYGTKVWDLCLIQDPCSG